MILAAFEREYRNIYGVDSLRSKDYQSIKAEAIKLLNEAAQSKTGKKRRYLRSIAKGIKNADDAYSDKVRNALLDCYSILEPFIRRRYGRCDADLIDEISVRVGMLRNSLMHSHLDINMDAVVLADIHIMEELVYIIRLKTIEKSEQKIQKAINNLFFENFAL